MKSVSVFSAAAFRSLRGSRCPSVLSHRRRHLRLLTLVLDELKSSALSSVTDRLNAHMQRLHGAKSRTLARYAEPARVPFMCTYCRLVPACAGRTQIRRYEFLTISRAMRNYPVQRTPLCVPVISENALLSARDPAPATAFQPASLPSISRAASFCDIARVVRFRRTGRSTRFSSGGYPRLTLRTSRGIRWRFVLRTHEVMQGEGDFVRVGCTPG